MLPIPEWNRAFPPELLSASKDQRKEDFRNRKLKHPKLDTATGKVFSFIQNYIPGQIIFVIGPTGVGKTTLREHVVSVLIDKFLENPDHNPGHLPVAGIELALYKKGGLNWGKEFTHALEVLYEPLVNQKVKYIYPSPEDKEGKLIIQKRTSVDDLEDFVIESLENRNCQVFYFDEAGHLLYASSPDKYRGVMDSIKSLANRFKKTVILLGTHDTTDLLDKSAQLDRRTRIIHFPRYDARIPEDVEAFKKIIRDFQLSLPLEEEADLVETWDYLYEGCLGCIGMLKDWLYLAVCDAINEDAKILSIKHLDNHRASDQRLINRATEIMQGEEKLAEINMRRELREKVGLEVSPSSSPSLPNSDQSSTSPSEDKGEKQVETENSQTRKPFERTPHRDEIGKKTHDER